MAKGGVTIEGMKALKETLTQVSPREATNIAKRTNTKVRNLVRDRVRERAPKGRTRNLVKSIKAKSAKGGRDRVEGVVWVDKSGGKTGKGYHWHLIEFGTVHTSKQEFVLPTIIEFRPKVPQIYRQEWWPQYRREMEKRAARQAAKQR